jgi:hypothetical protein
MFSKYRAPRTTGDQAADCEPGHETAQTVLAAYVVTPKTRPNKRSQSTGTSARMHPSRKRAETA